MSVKIKDVQATFTDRTETPSQFLRQAHPSPQLIPIIPQRKHFYRLTQGHERGTFFKQLGRSGTSAIRSSGSDPTP